MYWHSWQSSSSVRKPHSPASLSEGEDSRSAPGTGHPPELKCTFGEMEKTLEYEEMNPAGRKAAENWTVTDGGASLESVYVNAEARTGSRYAVQVSLCPGHVREGGAYLISVIQPWRATYVVADLYAMHLDYVIEKLRNPAAAGHAIHQGDAVAIHQTVNYALAMYEGWTTEAADHLRRVRDGLQTERYVSIL